MDLDGTSEETVATNLTNAVGVDYDWQRQCFFWTVVRATSSIDRLCHDGPPEVGHDSRLTCYEAVAEPGGPVGPDRAAIVRYREG